MKYLAIISTLILSACENSVPDYSKLGENEDLRRDRWKEYWHEKNLSNKED